MSAELIGHAELLAVSFVFGLACPARPAPIDRLSAEKINKNA